MTAEPTITREIAPLPDRPDDAHKGQVGRLVVIGGCCDEVVMAGAPALTANAAFRAGVGLVQVLVPEAIRTAAIALAPCATARTLPSRADGVLSAISDFRADVVALGPGLGQTLTPEVISKIVTRFTGPVVLDADGLGALSRSDAAAIPDPQRVVITPHAGEARRLLRARSAEKEATALDATPASRRRAACVLHDLFGCTVVLKGRGTIVTNGNRLYTNETGNSGLATGGTGDVLTGVIAALIAQQMEPLEAAILGVYLHGLAGDFAAEELGRWSLTATDLIDFLAEAFCGHQTDSTQT
ncbi:MAG: NAD(P)H-hydrate dehydratase [Phycisphaerae bacterium]